MNNMMKRTVGIQTVIEPQHSGGDPWDKYCDTEQLKKYPICIQMFKGGQIH